MYYVIGESAYSGTKYIYHSGQAFEYGVFTKELGYETYHKAELQLKKIDRHVNSSPITRACDLVKLSIEVHVPTEELGL